MSRRPTGRKRGGQPGNQNRLKHGLYARHLPVRRQLHLETLGLNRDELAIAVARARLKSLLDKQAAADPKDFLSYENAIFAYLCHITRLIHRNQDLARKTGLPTSAVRELLDLYEK